MCVSPLASLNDHRASSASSVCIMAMTAAPAQAFLSGPGLSQVVYQNHVCSCSLHLLQRHLFCKGNRHFARLETSVVFLLFPPPSHLPHGHQALPRPPPQPLPRLHLIMRAPCCQDLIPGKCNPWRKNFKRENTSVRIDVKKKSQSMPGSLPSVGTTPDRQ